MSKDKGAFFCMGAQGSWLLWFFDSRRVQWHGQRSINFVASPHQQPLFHNATATSSYTWSNDPPAGGTEQLPKRIQLSDPIQVSKKWVFA